MKYKIDVIKVGQSLVPGPEVYWMSHWKNMEQLYFYVVLIRNEDKNILINTGPPQDLTALNEKWGKLIGPQGRMVRQEDEEIEAVLKLKGLTCEDIDYILITPLQAYATANVHRFKNATVCISSRGWKEDYYEPVFPLHVEPELRITPEVLAYIERHSGKLRLVDDNETVLPGITAKWVGTHHRSSMAYCIDTLKGKVVVSDCFFKYGNLEEPHPLGILESMEECFSAYDWIKKVADIAIPLYDPEVMTRHPDGKVC